MSFSVQTQASISLGPKTHNITKEIPKEKYTLDYYPNKSLKKYDELKIKVNPFFNKTTTNANIQPTPFNSSISENTMKESIDYNGLPTTEEILTSDSRFSSFQKALNIAFPKGASIKSPFTIFVPTNEAFMKINNETLARMLDGKDSLADVVLRHLVAGTRFQIPVGSSRLVSVGGDRIDIKRYLNDIFSENVKISTSSVDTTIVQFHIVTSDGVIHAVDTLMDGSLRL